MANIFSVAVSYNDSLGYVEFDEAAHKMDIVLTDEQGRAAAEKFLTEPHDINVPHDNLMDFTVETINPLADVRSFQITLTRLWEETGVHVDWSRPVEYVKAHPHITH